MAAVRGLSDVGGGVFLVAGKERGDKEADVFVAVAQIGSVAPSGRMIRVIPGTFDADPGSGRRAAACARARLGR